MTERMGIDNMTWTAISWAFNEQPSAAKRNTEAENTTHVREEVNYYPVLATHIQTDKSALSSGYSATLTISVNDGAISLGGGTTAPSGGTDGTTGDVSISGLADGIHSINISLVDANDTDNTAVFYFYKSPDMEYLTCKYNMLERDTDDFFIGSASVTVIGHREIKSWT